MSQSPQKLSITKPTPISGFLEFTPEVQLHFDQLVTKIRALFASYGFESIEPPVVERMAVLAAKGGDVDKELYALTRAAGEPGSQKENEKGFELGLRYDLTVPFARYVAQHFGQLVFPFKRAHVGYCWRGERPQDGRYRQFLQGDVDVVNVDSLPLSFDYEIPLIIDGALEILGVQNYQFRISNRKILSGYLSGLGIENIQAVTRIIDKLDKIGAEGVLKMLCEEAKLSAPIAEKALKLATIKSSDASFVDNVQSLGVQNKQLTIGLEELSYVMTRLVASGGTKFSADLSITRGFDYYTGTVYEVRWNDHPSLGSIAAGGRYEDLASSYINKKIPGVGMSVGISRIFGKLLQVGTISPQKRTVTDALIIWDSDADEDELNAIATKLRKRGLNIEVFYEPDKVAKQLSYANKKGIPFVIFPKYKEFKNMQSGAQAPFDPETFSVH